ncbi:MAG: diguanylate cyclase domain-containing protein [Candidatus Aminicenantaceae bacterium]
MKVLIAEDSMISCRALAGNIQTWGYEVITTRNGQEAWDALNAKERTLTNGNKIRIALLDWEMPKINGIELCQRIRSRREVQPQDYVYIILMTGRDNQEDILQGLEAGADDYMTKPFDYTELKIRLQNGERVIDQEKVQDQIQATDSLTRLWNRNKILEFLDEEIDRSSRQNQPTSVLLMDIDGLARFNESDGFTAGDHILKEVSARIHDSMRRYDKLGRYGDDEFLGVFPNCSEEHIQHIAERLRRAVGRDAIQMESGTREVSLSQGGASTSIFVSCTGQQLLSTAQEAVAQAKARGGNTTVLLQPEGKH